MQLHQQGNTMTWLQAHSSREAIEEIAENYVFQRMASEDAAQYEEHLLVCNHCRESVETVEEFIHVFGAVLKAPEFQHHAAA
jgi:hypothetical protein